MVFDHVPPAPLLLIAHLVEAYTLLQHRYLRFLPVLTQFDLTMLQPSMFNYSTLNIIYDDSRARRDLGYKPGHTTLEGLCLHLLEWNEKAEQKLKEGKQMTQGASTLGKTVPVAPKGVAI